MKTWILLSLIYPSLYAFANIIDKFLLEKRIKNCFAQVFIISLAALLAALITIFFVPLSDISSKTIIIGLVAGLVYSIGYYLYFYTISFEEVSRFNYISHCNIKNRAVISKRNRISSAIISINTNAINKHIYS